MSSLLALDVGEQRVGVAIASSAARLPRPLTTLKRGAQFWDELGRLIEAEAVETIVVGLPRGLDGQETQQTAAVRHFVKELEAHFNLRIELQDEALTSHQATAELAERGQSHDKAAIDALAATYILSDFLQTREVSRG